MAAWNDFKDLMGVITALERRAESVAVLLEKKKEKAEQKWKDAEKTLKLLEEEALDEARRDVEKWEMELERVEKEYFAHKEAFIKNIREIDPATWRFDATTSLIAEIEKSEKERDDIAQKLHKSRMSLTDAQAAALSSNNIRIAKRRWERWNSVFDKIQKEADAWPRESRRRTAVAYCIAFENFLRDYLVEQAISNSNRDKFEAYVRARQGGLKINLPDVLNPDDVTECIAIHLQAFQDMGRVQEVYKSLFEKRPFTWNPSQPVFAIQSEQQDSLKDIELLFSIRHQLVHSNGRAGNKYQESVKKYRERFGTDLDAVPGPDVILSPKTKAKGSDSTKLEEIANSLKAYAEYVTKVCG